MITRNQIREELIKDFVRSRVSNEVKILKLMKDNKKLRRRTDNGQNRSKKKIRRIPTCYNCREKGHYAKNCLKKERSEEDIAWGEWGRSKWKKRDKGEENESEK